MKIGILSDTHDDIMMTRRALEEFAKRGVKTVIHAGDLMSPDLVELFEGFDLKIVFGNTDADREGIVRMCSCCGIEAASRFCDFEINGRKFFVIHGDDSARYKEAVESRKYDYIISGHTHMYSVKYKHNSLTINPGAVLRDEHSDTEETCAVLEVETGDVEKIHLG